MENDQISFRDDPWLKLAGLPFREPDPPDPEIGEESVGRLVDLLVMRYVGASVMGRKVPLKPFMDDLERRLIESCLSLTLGNQRQAAAILGIKPTALFEKLKKHGLRGPMVQAAPPAPRPEPVAFPTPAPRPPAGASAGIKPGLGGRT